MPAEFNHSLGQVLAEMHALPEDAFTDAGIAIYTAEEAREEMKERIQKVKKNTVYLKNYGTDGRSELTMMKCGQNKQHSVMGMFMQDIR